MLIWIIAIVCIVLGVLLFLTAPGRASREQRRLLDGRNIAHRGLYSEDGSVPENSLPAFRNAVMNGYGIELDVRLSADGEVIVFHDDRLSRLCSAEGAVDERTYAELGELPLGGTAERIPLLRDVLAVIARREPLVIELKRCDRWEELCAKTRDILDEYRGPVCVESFDPRMVRWFRKHAPRILRGQLTAPMRELGGAFDPLDAFVVSRCLADFYGRPQFIAYRIGPRSPLVRLACGLGALRVAWVSHDWSEEERADAVIFEHYRPRRRFRKST